MHIEFISEIDAPVSALVDFHFKAGAFEKLTPPWEKATVVGGTLELADGARAVIDTKIGPFTKRWVAVHYLTDDGFVDSQESGPFEEWTHHHRFEAIDDNRSRLTDSIDYQLPLGWIGNLIGGAFVRKKLETMFRYRHDVTKQELERG